MAEPTPPHPRGVNEDGAPSHEVPVELWALCVRDARRRCGLSQGDLASAADVSQQTISKVEAGAICPHDTLKVRLAAALGLPPGALFPWPAALLWTQTCDLARSLLDVARAWPATDA
jgi:DNA-binding XRE family transcriptional regulator